MRTLVDRAIETYEQLPVNTPTILCSIPALKVRITPGLKREVYIIDLQEKHPQEKPWFSGPTEAGNDIPVWFAIGFLIGVIFILDVASPMRLVFWTLYFFPLFLTLYVKQRVAHIVVGGVIVILVLAGIFLGSQNVQIMNTLLNRLLFSAVIAVLAYFIGSYRNRVAELRASREKLENHEEVLRKNEADLTASLQEKEVLLSEIHHRVKNNLTAFISLLNIDSSSYSSPEAEILRTDLQNRARSMALVHETLYETHNYSDVDMDRYLTALTGQVASPDNSRTKPEIITEAQGISLDLNRATPVGLIVNELVTNSLRYAFPAGRATCTPGSNDPCTIRVSLSKDSGTYLLRVSDNGIGLPRDFAIENVQSLGLKLVNFLAKHQLRAKVEVTTGKGTAFAFRFRE